MVIVIWHKLTVESFTNSYGNVQRHKEQTQIIANDSMSFKQH